MTEHPFDPDVMVSLMSQLLELPIAPEYRPGVIANLTRNAEIAQIVMEFPLPDDIEIAPVFQP